MQRTKPAVDMSTAKVNLCLDVECFFNRATRCASIFYEWCEAKEV